MPKTSSYAPWGPEHCIYLDLDAEQPCWGKVEVDDLGGLEGNAPEQGYTCQGHRDYPLHPYKQPPQEDLC